MSGARPWLRSESSRSLWASIGQTTMPPSPVVICLLA